MIINYKIPIRNKGFSLVEVVIAMGIAAVAFVSIIGLLPAAMQSEREGLDQTAIGTIYEDIHSRLKGVELKPGSPASVSPSFYDLRGVYWDPDGTDTIVEDKFYQVEVDIVEPLGSESGSSTPPLAIRVSIFWPLSAEGTRGVDQLPKSTITYYAASLAGPGWNEIDPEFVPKIEY